VLAGPGLDNIEASPGDDSIDGGTGYDFVGFYSSPAPIEVHLGDGTSVGWGTDSVSAVEGVVGSQFADRIFGSGGQDQLEGRAGADLINGLSDHDLFYGDGGNDRFRGGGGFDYVAYWTSPRGVNANLFTRVGTGDGRDTFESIEGLGGSLFADVLAGTRGPNGLYGESGADRLLGKGGGDWLYGHEGRDRLDGGGGLDFGHGGPGVDGCLNLERMRSCP
jgi:Ca2+-binding RTX toxin-like protein